MVGYPLWLLLTIKKVLSLSHSLFNCSSSKTNKIMTKQGSAINSAVTNTTVKKWGSESQNFEYQIGTLKIWTNQWTVFRWLWEPSFYHSKTKPKIATYFYSYEPGIQNPDQSKTGHKFVQNLNVSCTYSVFWFSDPTVQCFSLSRAEILFDRDWN